MEQLQERIKAFSDEQLIDQFVNHREEYIPEAFALIEDEIQQRNLTIGELTTDGKAGEYRSSVPLSKDDFTPFDHLFNNVDIEIAATVLAENKIPFYVDNPSTSNTLPLEGVADRLYSIHVENGSIDKAHELLDEHFEKNEGRYQLKKMSIKEQLKALHFTRIQMSESEAMDRVEVVLTPEEKKVISMYGTRLKDEVDQVEERQDRVVFYYDSIDDLLGYLAEDGELQLTKTEMVTILEILQIYCDEKEFPEFIEETIASLLSFFQS